MVIQAVNQRAKERYLSFLMSLTLVEEQFDGLDEHIRLAPRNNAWRTTRAELRAMRMTAFERLMMLREIAKRYESELLSREWRV